MEDGFREERINFNFIEKLLLFLFYSKNIVNYNNIANIITNHNVHLYEYSFNITWCLISLYFYNLILQK